MGHNPNNARHLAYQTSLYKHRYEWNWRPAPRTTHPDPLMPWAALALPREPQHAHTARRLATEIAASWGATEQACETVSLVISELASNVILHQPSIAGFTVIAMHTGDDLVFAVSNGPTHIHMKDPDPDSESGRGYTLIDALTSTWGLITASTGITYVYASWTDWQDRDPQKGPACPESESPTKC